MRVALVFVLALLVAGCGFHLRQQAALPFSTLYVDGNPNSGFVNALKRSIEYGSSTRLVDNPKEAEAVLQIVAENRQKIILSVSGGGQVQEYTLNYQVVYQVRGAKSGILVPRGEISLRRDISVNPSEVLAKQAEEALLYRDMQNDAVQQILRRLRVVKMNGTHEPAPGTAAPASGG